MTTPSRFLTRVLVLRSNSSEKPNRANDELFCCPLQHDRCFTGRERSPALNSVRFPSKHHPLAKGKIFQLFVVSLRIDSLHGLVS
jgi:hypothetical protein